MNMARIVIVVILGLLSLQSIYADDTNRNIRKAKSYQKKAEGYQREAAYYTENGKTDRANIYQRKANRAMDN